MNLTKYNGEYYGNDVELVCGNDAVYAVLQINNVKKSVNPEKPREAEKGLFPGVQSRADGFRSRL